MGRTKPGFFRLQSLNIPCSIWRGGTSRAVLLNKHDLPVNKQKRDTAIKRIIGSQDSTRIDGVGGITTHTSKVALICKSSRPDADIDYTIAQVSATDDKVDFSTTCGNIISTAAPFAINHKLIAATNGEMNVRIYDTNINKIVHVTIPVENGVFANDGDCFISGVKHPGTPIVVDYREVVGTKTGKVLPGNQAINYIRLESGQTIAVSICDVGTPAAFFRLETFLALDKEMVFAENDARFSRLIREIRGKAAMLAGLCQDWQSADKETPIVPDIIFVSPAPDNSSADIEIKLLSKNKFHMSIGGGAAVCVAAASRIAGSLVNSMISANNLSRDDIIIKHPQGTIQVQIKYKLHSVTQDIFFEKLAFVRTAREIMHGTISLRIEPIEELADVVPASKL